MKYIDHASHAIFSDTFWLEFIAILASTFLIGCIILFIISVAERRAAKFNHTIALLLKCLKKPFAYFWLWLLIILAVNQFHEHLAFFEQFGFGLIIIEKGLTLIFLWWALFSWTKTGLNETIHYKMETVGNRESYEHYIVIRKVSLALLSICALLLILSNAGIQIAPILAMGGIGGIAVAYAAKDIIGNILSGFIVQLSHPFQEGDKIKIPDKSVEGIVKKISWYYTTVEQSDGTPLYAPNADFASTSIQNLSKKLKPL